MSESSIASIVIAIIGGSFGLWAAHVSNRNRKDTRDITQVLANTKTPVDSLDQVVRLLQEELNRTNKANAEERKYFNEEIARIRTEHRADREEWERVEFKLQAEIDKLITERTELLSQIGQLKDKLTNLENQVRDSLKSVEDLSKI